MVRFHHGKKVTAGTLRFPAMYGTRVSSEAAKPADDTKLFRSVTFREDCEELLRDLTTPEEWATRWQMKLNVDKCKVMNIGGEN